MPWKFTQAFVSLYLCRVHKARSGLYTHGEYWGERVRMMQHRSDHIDFLRDGAKVLTGSLQKAEA